MNRAWRVSRSGAFLALAGVAGRWRVGALLHHLVTLLADGVQPLVLQEDGTTEARQIQIHPKKNKRFIFFCMCGVFLFYVFFF